jgi:hypothetical protein
VGVAVAVAVAVAAAVTLGNITARLPTGEGGGGGDIRGEYGVRNVTANDNELRIRDLRVASLLLQFLAVAMGQVDTARLWFMHKSETTFNDDKKRITEDV